MTDTQNPGARDWWLAVSVVAAAAGLLAAGVAWGMTPDEDEVGTSVLMTILQVQAIAHGAPPVWSSRLAFGVPLPGSQTLLLHPLSPLLAFIDPGAAIVWIDLLHVVVGACGFWWLCRTLKLSTLTTGVCAATFLLSSPSLTYTLTDEWPTYFVAWTLAPIALALMWRMIEPHGGRLRDALALGTVVGLMLADGHLGHAPFVIATLAAASVATPRQLRARAGWFALAAGLAIAIGGHHIWTATAEYLRFPSTLGRPGDERLGLADVADLLFRPLTPSSRGMHLVFFGGPFALLSALAIVRRDCAHPSRRFLVAGIAVAAGLLVAASIRRFPALSQTYLLRDPAIVCAIPLAGIALDRLRATSASRYVGAIVTLQLAAIFGGAWPFVARNIAAESVFQQSGADQPARALVDELATLSRNAPGRIYFTPEATRLWYESATIGRPVYWKTRLVQSGGMIVNGGAVKGVALEPLAPASARPYGDLDHDPQIGLLASSLIALGIRYVVATHGETLSPVLEHVTPPDPFPGSLQLWRNPRAWPGARFVDPASLPPPLIAGCPHARLLCRDFEALVATAERADPRVGYGEGELTIELDAANRTRTLLVTEMYREGWTASASPGNTPLHVGAVADALIELKVPPGARSVKLKRRP